jgi:hypothetical protein
MADELERLVHFDSDAESHLHWRFSILPLHTDRRALRPKQPSLAGGA